jgi:transposase-like protein
MLKKRMKDYPLEVKMDAVRLFFEEGKSRAEIVKILGIRGKYLVQRWVTKFRHGGVMAFTGPRGRPRKVMDTAARIKQLEMENFLLKKYHTELRKNLLAKRNIGSSSVTGRSSK